MTIMHDEDKVKMQYPEESIFENESIIDMNMNI